MTIQKCYLYCYILFKAMFISPNPLAALMKKEENKFGVLNVSNQIFACIVGTGDIQCELAQLKDLSSKLFLAFLEHPFMGSLSNFILNELLFTSASRTQCCRSRTVFCLTLCGIQDPSFHWLLPGHGLRS